MGRRKRTPLAIKNKDKSVTYRIEFKPTVSNNLSRAWTKRFTTKQEAEHYLDFLEPLIDRQGLLPEEALGQVPPYLPKGAIEVFKPQRKVQGVSFQDACDFYRIGCLKVPARADYLKLSDSERLRIPGTIRNKIIFLSFWEEALEGVTLEGISRVQLETLLSDLKRVPTKQGAGEKSNATYNRYRGAISRVLHYVAIEAPEKFIDLRAVVKGVRRLQEKPNKEKLRGKGDISKLLATCEAVSKQLTKKTDKFPHPLFDIVRLALAMGVRLGEIHKLTWEEVKLQEGKILIGAERTKQRKYRTIKLSTDTHFILFNRYKPGSTGLVFPSRDCADKPFDIRGAWNRARKEAGFSDTSLRDLRRVAACRARRSGMSILEVSFALGHSTIATTQRYIEEEDELKQEATLALQSSFSDFDKEAA